MQNEKIEQREICQENIKKPKLNDIRKPWFRGLKAIMRIFIKRSEFIYLDGEIPAGSVILSNHEGTSAPLAWDLYNDEPIRFWGAHEMNSGLVALYKYQTKVYYHEKKHWNLFLARLFCLLASPLTNMFYKGLNLISIYKDARLKKTFDESIDALNKKHHIVIFPEDSTNGYLPVLEGFHKGCVSFLKACLKKGMDVPVVVAYYKKKERKYIIGKAIYASELFKDNNNYDEIAKLLCDKCNALANEN